MLQTATDYAVNKPQRSTFGWLSLATGLLFMSQSVLAQTAPAGERNVALARIASKQIGQADSIARVTQTKKPVLRIDKINPAVPHSALFIVTTAAGIVDELPTLPSGGGMAALVEAVEKQVVSTPVTKDKPLVETSVYATFIISADGKVQQASIVEGKNAAINAAVLAAIQRLPRLTPGQVAGTAVPVKLTIPVQVKA